MGRTLGSPPRKGGISSLFQRATCLSIDKKMLVLVLASFAALCAYRLYSFWATGFFAADEYGYYAGAIQGTTYGGRWFVGGLNIVIFRAFGISSVDAFAIMLPFYLFLWGAFTILAFYGIMKLLGFDGRTVALSLFSSLFLVTFVLLSLGFLTEPVGLAFAMLGIYFLLRFLKSTTLRGRLILPILAALSLGAAGGSREPYNALLAAGGLVILIGLFRRPRGKTGWKLALLSLMLFLVPAASMYLANGYATAQAPSIGQQLGQAILSNPSNNVPSSTVTSQVTTTLTKETTITNTSFSQTVTTLTRVVTSNETVTTTKSGTATTLVVPVNRTTTIVTSTTIPVVHTVITVTTLTTNSTTTVVSGGNYPFYARSLLLNTLAIFAGGILLGWGPIAFAIGGSGFLLLASAIVRKKKITDLLVLMLALSALGSYLVVSFIFAPDPSYLSFQNYSTIIRFSDTAIPAYFLLAPIVIRHFVETKKALGFVAVLLAFLVVAVPVYQVYASSNLGYTNGNPFSIGYRSQAVQVRDYLAGVPNHNGLALVGIPYGWSFTPGIQDLGISLYYPGISNNPMAQNLTYGAFVANHWSQFYLFTDKDEGSVVSLPSYLRQAVPGNSVMANSSSPFYIDNTHVAMNGSDYFLIQVELRWK